MNIVSLMDRQPITVSEATPLGEVADLMLRRRKGIALVLKRGKLVGILTESSFLGDVRIPFSGNMSVKTIWRNVPEERLLAAYNKASRRPVRDYMTKQVVTASEDEPLREAVLRLLAHNVLHLPVVRDGKPTGVISLRALMKLARGGKRQA